MEVDVRRSIILLAGLLGGCMSNGSSAIRPLRPLEIPTAPSPDTISSSLTGSLFYEGGCLIFRDEDTHAYLLPVWPAGTEFNGTSVIFRQRAKADQRIVIGEEFLMSGQQLPYSALPGATYQPFERQCAVPPFLVATTRPAN